MQHFDAACQTEVFKRNIGILIGWGAKFELWHVEQRGSGGEACGGRVGRAEVQE
jgi:hypothetical protein